MTQVIFCQLAAGSFKMSDAKVVSVMYEEGPNEVQGLSTVMLWETKCFFCLPKSLCSPAPAYCTLVHRDHWINYPCSFSSACLPARGFTISSGPAKSLVPCLWGRGRDIERDDERAGSHTLRPAEADWETRTSDRLRNFLHTLSHPLTSAQQCTA